MTEDAVLGTMENAVNTYSSPSELRITDIRTATVCSNYDYPIIKIYTNQDVYGIGEVRDAGHRENALQYKSMLLGQNPCNLDMIYHNIKRYGGFAREGGGVSGIEIALMDLIGKVYGIPCYQLLGGKYRDKIRIYADTPEPDTPTAEAYAERVLGRKEMGLTFIKFDARVDTLKDIPGATVGVPTKHEYPVHQRSRASGTGQVLKITEKGFQALADIVALVRETVGWDVSLCIDHYGHGYLTPKEVIKLAGYLEPYALSWMEDPMPSLDVWGHKRVTDAVNVPIAGGEDLYLWDQFRPFIENRAVDIIHPDLLTSGGLTETKRISDYAERYGIPTALHFAGSPIAFMANLHTAAAISSFVALEHHGLDLPFWNDLVTGMEQPYLIDGYVAVPDKPGLGVDLNLEGIEANLRPPSGLFEPTDEWNTPKLGFWQPDRRWDK